MSEIQQTELLHFLFSDTLKCDILEPPSLKYLGAFKAVNMLHYKFQSINGWYFFEEAQLELPTADYYFIGVVNSDH